MPELVAHPAYRGPVVDAHTHFDATGRAHAHAMLDGHGVAAINLWNASWPPPSFPDWRAEWEAELERGMALMHVPDLRGAGEPGFEQRLVDTVHEAKGLGAVGLKLWKNLGLTVRDSRDARLAIDDARLDALWRAAAEADLAVAIHIADPAAFFEQVTPANERYEELLAHPEFSFADRSRFPAREQLFEEFEQVVREHPATTFVALHFGCFMSLADVRRMFATYPNYLVDTSARTFDLGRPDYREDALRVFAEWPERVIFGTDLSRTATFDFPSRSWARGDVATFLDHHWRLFETTDDDIAPPFEFQPEDCRLTGLGLDVDTLRLLYHDNAQRTYLHRG